MVKVRIELDFENEPRTEDVYLYLLELMEDRSLAFSIKLPNGDDKDEARH